MSITSPSDLDVTWDQVVEFLQEEEYSLLIEDRDLGRLTTDVIRLNDVTSAEVDGLPSNAEDYFVAAPLVKVYGKQEPTLVEGQWSMELIDAGDETVVAISAINLRGYYIGPKTQYGQVRAPLEVKSTGVFEKKLEQLLGGVATQKEVKSEPVIAKNEDIKQINATSEDVSNSNYAVVQAPEEETIEQPTSTDKASQQVVVQEQYRSSIPTEKPNQGVEDFPNPNYEDLKATLEKRKQDLDAREVALNLRETEIKVRENNVEAQKAALAESTVSQDGALVTSQPIASYSPSTGANRYVQFIATSAGRSFNNVAHLGDVVTEKVPGRSIYRYKVKGQYSDSDVRRVISELERLGYEGAFEN